MSWLRRLFCAHRSTIIITEEWGRLWRCHVCGAHRLDWSASEYDRSIDHPICR